MLFVHLIPSMCPMPSYVGSYSICYLGVIFLSFPRFLSFSLLSLAFLFFVFSFVFFSFLSFPIDLSLSNAYVVIGTR